MLLGLNMWTCVVVIVAYARPCSAIWLIRMSWCSIRLAPGRMPGLPADRRGQCAFDRLYHAISNPSLARDTATITGLEYELADIHASNT